MGLVPVSLLHISCFGYNIISSVAAAPSLIDPSRLKYPSMSTFVSWILYSMRRYRICVHKFFVSQTNKKCVSS